MYSKVCGAGDGKAGRGSQLNVGLMLTAKSACFPAQSNYYCLDKTKFSLSPKHFHSVQNIFTQYKTLSLRPKTFSLSPIIFLLNPITFSLSPKTFSLIAKNKQILKVKE